MTSPGAYSAGTAFLDVIPSFRGVQAAIRREVRDIEKALGQETGQNFGEEFGKSAAKAVDKALGTTKDSADKSGKDAAEKYAGHFADEFGKTMSRVQREMKALKLEVQPKGFDQLRKDMEALSKLKIGDNIKAGPALIELGRIEAKIRDIQDAATDVQFRSNIGKMAAEFEAFRKRVQQNAGFTIEPELKVDRQIGLFEKALKKRIEAALSNVPPIEFTADTSKAQDAVMELRRRLLELGDKRIGIDVSGADAQAEIEAVRRELAILATDKNVAIEVRTDAAAAAAELLAIRTLAEVVDKTKVDIEVEVEVDKSVGAFERLAQAVHRTRDSLLGAGADGQDGANSFRSFNLVLLAGAFAVSALSPLLLTAAGAIALFGTAAVGAAAGLGVLAFGFMGISDAVKALGKEHETAAKDAQDQAKAVRTASASVADAERSLDTARTAAAKSTRDSARDISDAEQNIADARADSARSARDSAENVAEAVDRVREAEAKLVDAQADVLQAQQDVTRAREDARDAMRDLRFEVEGGALAEKEQVLQLSTARARYKSALGDPKKSAADRAKLLIDLQQEDLRLRELRARNSDLKQEEAERRKNGIEGSDEVLTAQGKVSDAQERATAASKGVADAERAVSKARRDANERAASATRRIADAERALTDARAQAGERAASSQERIAAAQENLTQAQDKLFDAQNKVSASAQAANIAMAGLGPAGQAFAIFIDGLRDDFKALRDIVQENMLPGVQTAIETILTKNGPLLRDFLGIMGKNIGDLFVQFGDLMTSPAWQTIWATVTKTAPQFFTAFAQIGMALFTGLGEIFVALAPYAERLMGAIVGAAGAFARWAAGLKDAQWFRDFMAWFFENGPVVWDTVKNVALAFIALVVALEPLGMIILGAVDALARWIADLDPQVLAAIAGAILGIFIAFQLASGISALVLGFTAIFATQAGAVVFVIGLIVTALTILYANSETFRTIVDAIFRAIGNVIKWWWETIVFPAFDGFVVVLGAMGTAASWLWEHILGPVFGFIGAAFQVLATVVGWYWKNILAPVFGYFMKVAKILYAIVVVAVLGPIIVIWKELAAEIKYGWVHVIKPILGYFGEAWDLLALGLRTGWEWIYNHVIVPWFGTWESMEERFGKFVERLKKGWDRLRSWFAAPINFIIKWVLNEGLFSAFNWVIDNLNLDKSMHLDPLGYIHVGGKTPGLAAGGRVPGWSPNDRADNIPAMLTAGEYVHPVDSVNYYGSDIMEGIRKRRIPKEALQYYANGGVVGRQHLAVGGTVDAMWAWVKARHPYARLTSSYRPGDPGYHGRRQAIDVAGAIPYPNVSGRRQMMAINADIAANYPNSTELIHAPGINLWHGARHQYGRATLDDHYDHNHWAMATLAMLRDHFSGGGTFGRPNGIAGISPMDAYPGVTKAGIDELKDVFGKLRGGLDKIGDVAKLASGPLLGILKAVPHRVLSWMWGAIKDPVSDFFTNIWDSFMDDGSISPNIPKGELRQQVQGVATLYGWGDGAQWNALVNLINGESSWNPTAQNPSSTAYGLFQFLNSTWAGTGFEKTSDPVKQTQAGLTYIKNSYGSPLAAYRAWSARAPHWYSEGGPVSPGTAEASEAAPTLYDTGGWLPPGLHTVLNASKRPEPILTASQWDELIGARGAGDGARGIRELHLHEQAYDVSDSIAALSHAVKVIDRGGRYAEVGG